VILIHIELIDNRSITPVITGTQLKME